MATARPLGDRVLVKVIPRERVTTGGVILPDQAREVTDRGLVIAVGPGTWVASEARRDPIEASVNEIVLFSPYAGSKVAVENEDFLLLREEDLLGVLEGVEVVTDKETGELRMADPEVVSA